MFKANEPIGYQVIDRFTQIASSPDHLETCRAETRRSLFAFQSGSLDKKIGFVRSFDDCEPALCRLGARGGSGASGDDCRTGDVYPGSFKEWVGEPPPDHSRNLIWQKNLSAYPPFQELLTFENFDTYSWRIVVRLHG